MCLHVCAHPYPPYSTYILNLPQISCKRVRVVETFISPSQFSLTRAIQPVSRSSGYNKILSLIWCAYYLD